MDAFLAETDPADVFLPLAGGTMDSGADINFANASRLREGLTDAGNGGAGGIAMVCSLDYEFKWEAGRLYVMGQDGFTIRVEQFGFTDIPDTSDDETKGYMVGSRRILDDGTVYLCTDATTGAAVWEIFTSAFLNQYSGIDLTSTSATAGDDPTTGDLYPALRIINTGAQPMIYAEANGGEGAWFYNTGLGKGASMGSYGGTAAFMSSAIGTGAEIYAAGSLAAAKIDNIGTGMGLDVTTVAGDAISIQATAVGYNPAIYGNNTSNGNGVYGASSSGVGVQGYSGTSYGVVSEAGGFNDYASAGYFSNGDAAHFPAGLTMADGESIYWATIGTGAYIEATGGVGSSSITMGNVDAINMNAELVANYGLYVDDLYDQTTGLLRIDLYNQTIYTNSGSVEIDWSSGYLGGGYTDKRVAWQLAELQGYNGSSFIPALNWGTRQLIGYDGSTALLSWGDAASFVDIPVLRMGAGGTGISDYSGNFAIDPNDRRLFDSTTSTYASLEWNLRKLIDSSGVDSLNWANRQLFASDGTTVMLDWSNATGKLTGGIADFADVYAGSGGFHGVAYTDAAGTGAASFPYGLTTGANIDLGSYNFEAYFLYGDGMAADYISNKAETGPPSLIYGASFTPTAYASLPASPVEGTMCYVNDADSPVSLGAVVTNGGTEKVLACFNGTDWKVIAYLS